MNEIEKAIEDLRSYADASWGGLNDTFELALAALRAEEEREKGCEGCGGRSSATRKLPYQCQYCCRNYCDQHDGRRGAAVELDGGGQDARKGEAE